MDGELSGADRCPWPVWGVRSEAGGKAGKELLPA